MQEFEDIILTKELVESMYNQELEFNGILPAKQKRKNYYKIIYDKPMDRDGYGDEIARIYYLNLKIENQDDFEYVKDIIEKYKINVNNELNCDELIDTEFNFCLSVDSKDKETQQYIESVLIDSINKADPLYTISLPNEKVENPNKKDKHTLLDDVVENSFKLGLIDYKYINEEKVLKESEDRRLYEMSLYESTPYVKHKNAYESTYFINYDDNKCELSRIYYFNISLFSQEDISYFKNFNIKYKDLLILQSLNNYIIDKHGDTIDEKLINPSQPILIYNIQIEIATKNSKDLINDTINLLNKFNVNDSILLLSLNQQILKLINEETNEAKYEGFIKEVIRTNI